MLKYSCVLNCKRNCNRCNEAWVDLEKGAEPVLGLVNGAMEVTHREQALCDKEREKER